jgi:hypothetical protein
MTPVQLVTGGLAVVGIGNCLIISVISIRTYKDGEYPGLKWALGVGLSLGAFGTATYLLGTVAATGVGAVALLAGAVAVLLVAGTISTTSHIRHTGMVCLPVTNGH